MRDLNYLKDTAGNFAVTTAIGLTLVLSAVAAAIDMAQIFSAKDTLQSAADQAAVAGANHLKDGFDEDASLAHAEQVFVEKLSGNTRFTLLDASATLIDNTTLQLAVQSAVKNDFGHIMNKPTTDISLLTEVSLSSSTVSPAEFAVVVDATSSMNGQMRDALEAATDIFERINTHSGDSYITLVPFQDSVNIGTQNIDWVSAPVSYDGSRDGPDNWEDTWDGCVGPREEAEPGFEWAVNNTHPDDLSFPAEIPDFHSRDRQVCMRVPITGPTTDVDVLNAAVAELKTDNHYYPGRNATGRLDAGFAWGWRTLSQEWQNEWGDESAPSAERKKYLIFISDGRTEAYTSEMDQERSWEFNEGSETGFEHLVEVCNKAKADDIEVHVLMLNGNDHAVPYFQDCASRADTFYAGSDADLVEDIFEDIAHTLTGEDTIRFVQ